MTNRDDNDNDTMAADIDGTGDEVNEDDIDLSQATIPINVHPEGTDANGTLLATFDYVGEDYDDFVNDINDSFVAPNSNCTLS